MAFTTANTIEYSKTFEHGSNGSKNRINYPAPVQLPPASTEEPKKTNWVFASVKCRKAPVAKPVAKPVVVEEQKEDTKKKKSPKKNKKSPKKTKKSPKKAVKVEPPKEEPKEPESWVSKTQPEKSDTEDESEDEEELLLRLVTQNLSLEKKESKKHAKIESPFIEEEKGWDLVKPKPTPKNRDHVRSQALDTLADQKKLREAKKYTKLCDSVTSGKPCRHGERCRFAHSIEQLTVSPCFFEEKCRHVKNVGGMIHNIDGRPCCRHIHPGETKDHFLKRTGVQLPTPPAPTSPPTSSQPTRRGLGRPPKNQSKPREVEPKKRKMIQSKTSEVYQKPQPVYVKPVEIKEEMCETLIQVSNEEMATQAMELAIKSGVKNVRVEIIHAR